MAYLSDIEIAQATPMRPITEIAAKSGFQSIRSLDHVCKQIYGRTPSELRREHYV